MDDIDKIVLDSYKQGAVIGMCMGSAFWIFIEGGTKTILGWLFLAAFLFLCFHNRDKIKLLRSEEREKSEEESTGLEEEKSQTPTE